MFSDAEYLFHLKLVFCGSASCLPTQLILTAHT